MTVLMMLRQGNKRPWSFEEDQGDHRFFVMVIHFRDVGIVCIASLDAAAAAGRGVI